MNLVCADLGRETHTRPRITHTKTPSSTMILISIMQSSLLKHAHSGNYDTAETTAKPKLYGPVYAIILSDEFILAAN